MRKSERLDAINKIIARKGSVRIYDLVDEFKVSDMTIRRDLSELEKDGLIIRVHGGAKSKGTSKYFERSHEEKHFENMEEKKAIAKKAISLIDEGDSIFLGPGTTIEMLADELNNQTLQVVTNCLPIFNTLYKKSSESFKIFLLGGEMRKITQSFVGNITNTSIERLNFDKMFFSCNAFDNGEVMTSALEEALTQRLALSHSSKNYLLIDSSKIGKKDFTSICNLSDVNRVILEKDDSFIENEIGKYTKIL